jgi:hypothetical protein
VARVDDLLIAGLKALSPKPPDSASQSEKRKYSQDMSAAIALALAEEFRHRGMKETRPAGPGDLTGSGAERRLAGGIGAKKVDVTWTTEESGLLFGERQDDQLPRRKVQELPKEPDQPPRGPAL